MGCSQKSFKLVWLCHQHLPGFLAKDYLPRVSRQSSLSAKDNCGNEMKPGAIHRSPGIYLTADENPGRSQLGDRLIKATRPVISSYVVFYLQMTSAGSHNTPGRKKEEMLERIGFYKSSEILSLAFIFGVPLASSHSTSVREEEEKKEMMGKGLFSLSLYQKSGGSLQTGCPRLLIQYTSNKYFHFKLESSINSKQI